MTTEQRERAQQICDAADRGGVVQADEMLRLYPGQPERHTATLIRVALREDASDQGYLDGWQGRQARPTAWGLTLAEAAAYLDGFRDGWTDRLDPFLQRRVRPHGTGTVRWRRRLHRHVFRLLRGSAVAHAPAGRRHLARRGRLPRVGAVVQVGARGLAPHVSGQVWPLTCGVDAAEREHT